MKADGDVAIALLDSNVLGVLTSPNITPHVIACQNWESDFIALGNEIAVPSLIVYEVKRELKRAGKIIGMNRLTTYISNLLYLPLSDEV